MTYEAGSFILLSIFLCCILPGKSLYLCFKELMNEQDWYSRKLHQYGIGINLRDMVVSIDMRLPKYLEMKKPLVPVKDEIKSRKLFNLRGKGPEIMMPRLLDEHRFNF